MGESSINYVSYPKTQPSSELVLKIVAAFVHHESAIATEKCDKGLVSNQVLACLCPDLVELGFQVETSAQGLVMPVLYGENGRVTLKYRVDAYHSECKCVLQVEASRGCMGGAVYRDLVQAVVMEDVDCLVVAVANQHKYKGRTSYDYRFAKELAETLYSQRRAQLPYGLTVIGY